MSSPSSSASASGSGKERRLLLLALALCCIVSVYLWSAAADRSFLERHGIAASTQEPTLSRGIRKSKPIVKSGHQDVVHVVFCTDDTDLRSLVAAIKSILESAAVSTSLVFHIIVPVELVDLFKPLLTHYLPDADLDFISNGALQAKLLSLVPVKVTNPLQVTSPSLRPYSPFNFASLFLDNFMLLSERKAKRVLYMDTDVVVQDDLAELYNLQLNGKAVGAVKDCATVYDDYFNLYQLSKMGFELDPAACLFQRGVQVLDLTSWQREGLAGKVENWLMREREAEESLWSDVVQPAWMLALEGHLEEINPKWNCFNLGEVGMTYTQAQQVRQMGLDHQTLLYDLALALTRKPGTMKPFLATCSQEAKVLHYSGEQKPWLAGVWSGKSPAPLCFAPSDLKLKHRDADVFGMKRFAMSSAADRWVALDGQQRRIVRCLDLWYEWLTVEEDCALKDIEKEWAEEEQVWRDTWVREQKKKESEQQKKEEGKKKDKNAAAMSGLVKDNAAGKPTGDSEVQPSQPDSSSSSSSSSSAQESGGGGGGSGSDSGEAGEVDTEEEDEEEDDEDAEEELGAEKET